MAIDLTGIRNENDFYSHHYLSAIFEGDLKDIFKGWQAQEETYREAIGASGDIADASHPDRAPWVRLRALGQDFFRIRNRLDRERSTSVRVELQREFFASLLHALGYDWRPQMKALDTAGEIPVLCEISRGASPDVWVLGVLDASREGEDPLSLCLHEEQFLPDWCESNHPDKELLKADFDTLISKHIFVMEQPPRWLLLISDAQLLLIDRTKWHEKRLLRFDLAEIFGRKQEYTFKAMAALLVREHIAPEDGLCLIDTLDENAYRHDRGVSEDLKYALRQCIELLGNETVHHLRKVSKTTLYTAERAAELSRECLRYMYRILFLFYVESRPELGYVPFKSEAYRSGYSLETLRDLEMVPLHTEEARQGTFICDSIQLLFDLIYKGFDPHPNRDAFASSDAEAFALSPLNSHLFDPQYTPTLNKVRFNNEAMQRIIRLMSLTRPARGKNQRRRRISYAQLGINQLGAVYEALLSYQGFFARHDLFEVKKAGENPDELDEAWFVTEAALKDYTEEERVLDENGGFKRYEKGTFIYRMSGRIRQKSASYYTPEVLTKSLVKYALKELLRDKSADDILKLKVCEPAMGSAAFLNEAINQLAEAYLSRKRKETGAHLAHDDYSVELQKVRMYLADNNVFGIDLNPVAVELAEVSLWLNAIYSGGFVPWFGLQLFSGNSLIGTRRQVYHRDLLEQGVVSDDLWHKYAPSRLNPYGLTKASPLPAGDDNRDAVVSATQEAQAVGLHEGLKDHNNKPMLSVREGRIYHFLLPDPGMANYNNNVIMALVTEDINAIKEWRRTFCTPFTSEEIKQLQIFSDRIDDLWAEHARHQAQIRERTTDPLTVWGQPEDTHQRTSLGFKDKVLAQERESKDLKNSSAYRRLKLVMDYWCALWFWPIHESGLLPDRAQYFMDLHWLLAGNVMEPLHATGETANLFPETRPEQESLDFNNRFGQLDIDKILRENPRLKLANDLATRHRFFHWELEFADLFVSHGGFDLVLGNPPWIKVEWQEGGVMGDFNPLFVLRKFTAPQLNALRDQSFDDYPGLQADYISEFEEAEATQNFLNAMQNYPLLRGQKANLYKCFLPQAWMVGNAECVSGFLHPEGVYDDPKGGLFRAAIYPRLRGHFQFHNELKLFNDVHHATIFSINVFGARQAQPALEHLANLFAPITIDNCYQHSGHGPVPGIKNDEGKWNTVGHAHRIIEVDEDVLSTFTQLYDEPGTPALQARLPALHTRQLLSVLEKFARHPRRLGDLKGEYFPTQHWNEVNAQNDGTIRRETRFPDHAGQWILSGPHFFVGTQLYKTPRAVCTQNSHYDVLDLTDLPDDYLPRSNYVPACDEAEYQRRTPRVPWVEEGETERKRVTAYYRHISREMIGPSAERTFIPMIAGKEVGHVNTCITLVFRSEVNLIDYTGMGSSLPVDFFVKSTGQGHANINLLRQLPLYDGRHGANFRLRNLACNCLTSGYADLWKACWADEFIQDSWTKTDLRLPGTFFLNLTEVWHRDCALRTDYARRQALVEIDVLAAMALGLTLDELIIIYRVQFPVMRQYEADTWYDANGRIVFTVSKGLTGVGFPRKAGKNDTACEIQFTDGAVETKTVGWEDARKLPEGARILRTVTDDTLPGGPREKTITYVAPFDRCDREQDYQTAWRVFKERASTAAEEARRLERHG